MAFRIHGRFQIVYAVVISVFLMISDQRFDHLSHIRYACSLIIYPLQFLVDGVTEIKRYITSHMRSREELITEAHELQKKNLRIRTQLQRYESVRQENTRLRELLAAGSALEERTLFAQLVASSGLNGQFALDRGRLDHVYPGQAVISAQGLMGQVLHVHPYRSTVLPLTDVRTSVPVEIIRNGLRGIAVGLGNGTLALRYIDNDADVRADDQIVTSGVGGKYPSNFPVGSVLEVNRNVNGTFSRIIVMPVADLERTREFLLIWNSRQQVQSPW